MSKEIIEKRNIFLDAVANDWKEAISVSGKLLEDSKYITKEYTKEMIQAVEDIGPYIVVAPYIAFAHSRPSKSVLKTGISIATLKEPVVFGHEENDPVKIIFGLCATDKTAHIDMLSDLCEFLDDESAVDTICACKTVDELYNKINN
ncbi:PTS sugar transporter subunit IIA [Vibrio rumoiensis]|uniref:PTS sugar transporter subunit IIA n=1 Tax=Vibrio rumoiensis TaxID=76258 RepID=UPI000B5CC7CC|nr:PTS sugar transporter subunit IIA [Vibrio rumoiensis]